MAEVLRIEDLHVSFDTYAGEVRSVRGVSFHVNERGSIGRCWRVWMRKKRYGKNHYEAQSYASSTDQARDYFALRNRYRCRLRKERCRKYGDRWSV